MVSKQWEWPTLNDNRLVSVLCDMGANKDEATAATKASPESIKRTFEFVLEKVFSVSRNDLAPDFRCTGHMRYPELHDEGLYVVELFRSLKHWLYMCGVDDFGVKDLCEPQPKRFRRQISAILNFARFKEWKLDLEEQLELELESGFEVKADLQRSLQHDEAELQQLMQEEERKQEAAAELRVQTAEAKAQLSADAVRFEQSSERLAAAQREVESLDRKIKSVRFVQKTEVETRIMQLRSRVVESPEKLLQEIEGLQQALAQVDANNAAIDQSTFDFQQRSQCVAKLHKEVAEMLNYVVNKVIPTMQEKKCVSKECKAKQAELEQANLQQDALVAKSNHLKQNLQAAKEALARDLKQSAARKDAAASKLEMAKREKEKNEAKAEVIRATIQENQAKAKKQRDKRKEFESAINQKTEDLLHKYSTATQALARYHSKFGTLLDTDFPSAADHAPDRNKVRDDHQYSSENLASNIQRLAL